MERRTLRLDSYDDVVREAEALHTSGYDRAGKWGLGEICQHLAIAMEMSLDGFPKLMPWPVRVLFRWLVLPRMLRHGVIRRAVKGPDYLMPPDNADESAGLERLRRAVQRLQTHEGPLKPSPLFGNLTAEEWRGVTLWHSEHHLSFLIPRTAPEAKT